MIKLRLLVKTRKRRCGGFLTEWLELSSGSGVLCQLHLPVVFEGWKNCTKVEIPAGGRQDEPINYKNTSYHC